ncbi:hypothetical protein HLB23_25395 [Nocardia uniformis]|uniref:Uncharacterized protein n=1 Tax=Nocardia uniformis TaxID=53432 RepID=A0A849CA36_9NOCA|nr:hypothetical protein [Nocardia uniformis]NNH73155.1 hypothetical protein [Nocardia uniformis]
MGTSRSGSVIFTWVTRVSINTVVLGVAATGDDVGDVVRDAGQQIGCRCGGGVVEGVGEFVALVGELCCLGAQFGQSGAEGFSVEAAVFERGQVAVDHLLGFGEFGGEGGQFGAGVRAGVVVALPVIGDGLIDEVVAGAVELCERVEDGGVDGVGVEAGEVACGGVVAGAVEAGVVAVGP